MNKKQMVWLSFLFVIIVVLGSIVLSSLTGEPFYYYTLKLLAIVCLSVLGVFAMFGVVYSIVWIYESLGD